MTYIVVMLLLVSGLFATDGGTNLNVLSPEEVPLAIQKAAVEAESSQIEVHSANTGELGLFRIFLENGHQCILTRNKQAMSCSAQAKQKEQDISLKLQDFEQGVYPAPGLYRLRFADGVECVLTAAKTGLSCQWGVVSSPALAKVKSIYTEPTTNGPAL